MLARSLLVLEIVSIIAFVTNGYNTNPYFICQSQAKTESYMVTMSRQKEITVVNCTRTRVNEILARISRTKLRGRPIRLHMSANELDHINVDNVTTMDLSGNALTEARLQKFTQLRRLNLTLNRIPSLRDIKLRPNVTLFSLDVSRNRLLRLEQSSIPPTNRLFLTSNNIFDLDQILTLPTSLVLLDLTRNEIENISLVSFASNSLIHLNLSVNLINAVSRTTFGRLPSLETLILECNKIFEIEPGTFSGNLKLVELNLRDNNLAALKKGVFDELVNLQVLDISKNDLLKLAPDAVQNLNLIDFSVSENAKLCDAECKEDMEFLLVLGGRLRALKMDRLRLRQFPVMLTTSVRHLDLSENELDAVQLGNLENFPFLVALTLSGNNIETTENDVFSRMEFLEVLCLDNNKLERVPTVLPQSLRELYLNQNRIAAIGKNDFNGLTNLKTLKLNSNSIEMVENGAFRFLVSLEMLDISDNPLKILNTEAFEGPSKLQILQAADLSVVHINVTDVRYFPISELPNLRKLNLSRSPEMVKSFLIDVPLLATVKQLEILDLSNAHLTQLPTYLENFLPRLRQLRLTGNALNCTNTWWHEWRQSNTMEVNEWVNHENELTVEVIPTDTKPLHDSVGVDSDCTISETDFTTTTSTEFWASIENNVTNAYHDSRYENFTTNVDHTHRLSESVPPLNSTLTLSNAFVARFAAERKKVSSRSVSETQIERNTFTTRVNIVQKSYSKNLTLETPTKNFTTFQTLATNKRISIPRDHINEKNILMLKAETKNLTKTTTITTSKAFMTSTHTIHDGTIHAESLIFETPTKNSLSVGKSMLNGSTTEAVQLTDHDSTQWNSSMDLTSFFDWFPSYNDTFKSIEQTATMDDQIAYTHPGLVIFSAITCFLSVIFLTLIAPSCIQKYKWNRYRYKNAEFEDEYQQNIEISSVSAIIETEISLD